MWILPNNHPLASQFAPDYSESNEDLKEYFQGSEPPLMWKSKPSSWKTFCQQWKRVWWMQHLSGRILKPSTRSRFEAKLTSYLADTHASRLVLPATGGGLTTQDTFGRIYSKLQAQLSLFAVSSKTCQDTFQWDMTKFTETFEVWVTELRAESTQRQKLARHTRENAFSYLPSWGTPDANLWKGAVSEAGLIRKDGVSRMDRLSNQVVHQPWRTPMASDFGGSTREDFSPKLSEQVQNWGTPRVSTNGMNGTNPENPKGRIEDQVLNWPTPLSSDAEGGTNYNLPTINGRLVNQRKSGQIFGAKLRDVAVNWPTPVTMDAMNPKTDKALIREKEEIRPGRTSFSNLLDSVVQGTMTDFQPDKELSSTIGKNRARLNPAWSIQLMGTTLQRIFTVPLAIQLLNKQQN